MRNPRMRARKKTARTVVRLCDSMEVLLGNPRGQRAGAGALVMDRGDCVNDYGRPSLVAQRKRAVKKTAAIESLPCSRDLRQATDGRSIYFAGNKSRLART